MPGRVIYLMGPSGAGKDSLIDAARQPIRRLGCEVAKRVITRSAESVGEEALEVTSEEFERRVTLGEFALFWRANGLGYGIPRQIDTWLARGRNVLVNGSRGYLRQARERYPDLIPIVLTVDNEVLRRRLLRRARESLSEIERRLQRNQQFVSATWLDEERVIRLDNSGELEATLVRLLAILREQGVNPVPGQT
ncbi:phosphonate metabolism protein/1,5-bisphosphokinase (PRPP-forming) PhnN [Pseudomonas sp. TKO26]|uniref:phosphonate metabolism protein/1,5-bisphosphokinase (PRPP-forming) PhnN n=1 Tax=unclassified Pseudomonas TaxID=196821 RepID=UPI000D9A3C1C|nr:MULTISPECIES: phosphonate metabolism protein/1,5-bisphosphokinase (PRPP-forming) PhnN [unclassified Pseudomonas]PYY92574.1 phosphonate metabolism protein/1,5-bisphosphokinase (PRPP-forming) PhnN [Pseudomonas sp. TKO30]PYY94937.1 phosphonate metabolism protein/1,5-bisphosphokinase (PRPP-forming) PhnN [Pseudomonas sp. TKO29]PYY96810.1 phosphonate metabolism protein/1,5-bisphosphokinase (PRPP-forming) PhnN [Pseudomonas sp. TKO26]PYZ02402.1 phosphonate metabolism protein/1,5-bisphosphokinase (PR